jgi:hypothetical protein
MLEQMPAASQERTYRHRLGIPAEKPIGKLPPQWIDAVLDVEFGCLDSVNR